MLISKYAFGILLILCVVVLWVGSSELIQCILADFDSPFFLTYFSTSLFVLYLFIYLIRCMYYKYCLVEMVVTNQVVISFRDTFKIALILSPIWFLLNFTFNYSLARTSLASNTIISSTSSVWTLILAVVVLYDKVKWYNVVGVCLTVSGVIIVALNDVDHGSGGGCSNDNDTTKIKSSNSSHNMMGDIWCLISAICYGIYTITLKRLVAETIVDMQLLFGQIGLINMCLFWPGFLIVSAIGVEPFSFPSGKVIGYLFLNGIFGTVISDLLWAKSVLLTTPVIATLGITLTIPLAMIVDLLFNDAKFNILYYMGSLIVVSGFILVNWRYVNDDELINDTEIIPLNLDMDDNDNDNDELQNTRHVEIDNLHETTVLL